MDFYSQILCKFWIWCSCLANSSQIFDIFFKSSFALSLQEFSSVGINNLKSGLWKLYGPIFLFQYYITYYSYNTIFL